MTSFIQVFRSYGLRIACETAPVYMATDSSVEIEYIKSQIKKTFYNYSVQGIFPQNKYFQVELELIRMEDCFGEYFYRWGLRDLKGNSYDDFSDVCKQFLLSEHKQSGMFLIHIPNEFSKGLTWIDLSVFWHQILECKKQKNLFVMLIEDLAAELLLNEAEHYVNIKQVVFPNPKIDDYIKYLLEKLNAFHIPEFTDADKEALSTWIVPQIESKRLDFTLLERLAEQIVYNFALQEKCRSLKKAIEKTLQEKSWTNDKFQVKKHPIGFEVK